MIPDKGAIPFLCPQTFPKGLGYVMLPTQFFGRQSRNAGISDWRTGLLKAGDFDARGRIGVVPWIYQKPALHTHAQWLGVRVEIEVLVVISVS